MTKEEVKQYLRSKIDSSFKTKNEYDFDWVNLSNNKQYDRLLKLSKITGQPVNKENFTCGDKIFLIDIKNKAFCGYPIIRDYLKENYSKTHSKRCELIEEVINEYDEYKGYNCK